MPDNTSHDTRPDGGVPGDVVNREQQTDYLQTEINILNPSTPYMRDHLKVIWTGFTVWIFTTFGPVTATVLAPDIMTSTMPVLGFPWHYFGIAIGGPGGSLLLATWYARKRDQLDEKYGIDHSAPVTDPGGQTTAADGGEEA
ncbi:MAG: DUF4212 domain-containing protein [Salinarchaeum sp.]